MPDVQYGSKVISYSVLQKEGLKSHYITVDKNVGVVLKGKPVSPDTANKLILKRARWILDKLRVVGLAEQEDIVTGSRIQYLGKYYYVEVVTTKQTKKAVVAFNHSRFIISVSNVNVTQEEINTALELFYKEKAIQKITPRLEQWAAKTKLKYAQLQFRKMNKRWGSCTSGNNIIINIEAIKLPWSLIDYLLVHELCHTKVKDHSKAFWAELSKHIPKWKELDERVAGFGL